MNAVARCAAICIAAAAAAAAGTVPSAQAAPAAGSHNLRIAPGQPVVYIAGRHVETCTLGFVFAHAGHSYAVTAGHCITDRQGYPVDTVTRDRGQVNTAAYDPDRRGRDIAILDFGKAPLAPTLFNAPTQAAAPPAIGHSICHTGISSGTSCGSITGRYGDQYLTTGLRDIPGDSGGPVWTSSGHSIAVVGIWLGSHITNDGTRFGRFYPLPLKTN